MSKKQRGGGFSKRQAAEAVAKREQQLRTARMVRWVVFGGLFVATAVFAYISSTRTPATEPAATTGSNGTAASLDPIARNGMYSEAPAMGIDTAKAYEAIIKTERGDMRFELFDDQAPVTVNNFVFLAREGYYNNTTFHRVLPNFMAQGGDPTGTGTGGPGYQFEDEFDPTLRFDRRGLLAMANAGPATNGSQFFITFGPTQNLNDAHTIFGELVEGDEVLSSIRLRDPNRDPEPGDEILSVEIVER